MPSGALRRDQLSGPAQGGIIESELFGHEKGAFTGAAARRERVFERAGEGLLFLDEIGDMPIGLQPRLLRVIQQRRPGA